MRSLLPILALLALACGSGGSSSVCADLPGEPLTPDLARSYGRVLACLDLAGLPAPLLYLAPSERPSRREVRDPGRDWCIAGTARPTPGTEYGWSCSRGELRCHTEGRPTVVVADMAVDREALFRHEAIHHARYLVAGDADAAHAGPWWACEKLT